MLVAEQTAAAPVLSQEYEQKRRFTVEEVYKLFGAFPEERWELIDGEIISKMGQNPLHSHIVRRLVVLLANVFGIERVQSQMPMRIPGPDSLYSEPEPDVVLLKSNSLEFSSRHPAAEDTSLVIEVSSTTLQYDGATKYKLYARAGVQEYWVIDIPNRRTFVCREPAGEDYKTRTLFQSNEPVTSPAVPGFTLVLNELFPSD